MNYLPSAPALTQRTKLPNLLPNHIKMLLDSAIDPAVVEARGVISCSVPADIAALGFSQTQAAVGLQAPVLLFRIWNVGGEPAGWQMRPDTPRVGSNGRVIKYETPAGGKTTLDVHPFAFESLRDGGTPLLVTEGVKKADAVLSGARREGIAICPTDLSGVNMAKTPGTEAALDSIPLMNRTVFVGFDSDVAVNEAVNRAATDLGRSLQGRGAVVRYILLDANREGGKVGLDDALASGTKLAELLAGAVTDLDPVRQRVEVTTRVDRMVTSAVSALARSQDVYVSGEQLAYLVNSTVGRTCRIEPFKAPAMRTALSKCADWQTFVQGKAGGDWKASQPPTNVVTAVLAPQDWPGIRRLDLITETPCLLPDFTITTRPGFYESGRLLYQPRRPVRPIPEEPSLQECKDALSVLLEPFRDFTFEGESDRSAAIAAVLTLLAEPALGGPTPIVAITGNSPGCGKGLLVNTITRIGLDAVPAFLSGDIANEEFAKIAPCLSVSGERAVLMDNLTAEVRLPALDAAVTTGHMTYRILGESRVVTVPSRMVFFTTGNNLTFAHDSFRRTMFIRLRATVERPEERNDFRHNPLGPWVEKNLPDLLTAALTILRGFIAAGLPQRPDLVPLGSFESWHRIVRQCVVWLGMADPLGARGAMRLLADPDDDARRTLVTHWHLMDPTRRGLLARDVIALLFGAQADPMFADLREAVETLIRRRDPKDGKASTDENRLGRVLTGLRATRYRLGESNRWLDRGEGNSRQGNRWFWYPGPEETRETSSGATEIPISTPSVFPEGKTTSPTSPRLLEPPFIYISSRDAAVRVLNEAALSCSQGMIVGVTLEPKGLSPLTSRPRLLQIAAPDRPVAVIDLDQTGGLSALAEHLRPLRGVAHNAASEMGFLRHHGGLDLTLDCTLLAEHVLTGKTRSLADVLRDRLGLTVEGSTEFQASGWSGDLSPEQLQYAAANAEAARQLLPVLQAELERLGATRAYELARDAQPAVVSMALAGVPIDREEVERLLAEVQPQQAAAEARARKIFGPAFNIRSSTQLEQLLIEGLPPEMTESWPRTPKGALETGTKVLAKYIPDFPEPLRSHFRNVILPYKALLPLEQALPHYNVSRVHPHMNMLGAPTGRMSCSGPNIQGLPRALRSIVRAPEGHRLVLADYSQIEFLVAAALAGDRAVLNAFARGVDVHVSTAAAIRGCSVDEIEPKGRDRQVAKAANYGLLYGQGVSGFRTYASQTYGVALSPDEAARVRESWFAAYPKISEYQNRLVEEWQGGRLLQSPMGRPLYPTKYTEALNYPAQAAGAEIIHASLGFVHRNLAQFGGRVVPILAVHDEIVLLAPVDEADAAARVLEESMTEAALSVLSDLPSKGLVEAKVGVTWADKG